MQTDTCSSGPIYPMDLFILTKPMSTATELSMVVPWPLFTLWPQALLCHAALIVVKGKNVHDDYLHRYPPMPLGVCQQYTDI